MNRFLCVCLLPISLLLANPTETPEGMQYREEQDEIDFDELYQFLKDFKFQLELTYGVSVDMDQAINIAKNAILASSEYTVDEKNTIVNFYDILLEKFRRRELDFRSFGSETSFELSGKIAAGLFFSLKRAMSSMVDSQSNAF
ncbi:MAG TPA: hypothetical protein VLG44_01980 [Chlamydiales bacterium]|nr:hypothetical protein [Chlamydiales bacterium]